MGALIRETFGEPVMMRKAYGEALVELGRSRSDVVCLSADVSNSDYSFMFEAAFPDRFFNVGIAEPALVDISVGLAKSGWVPVANTFAVFLASRALEMVQTHMCIGGANVKLAATYAGLSDSFDGPTHQAISDIAIMRSLPHMTIVVPADSLAISRLLPQVAALDGPVFMRVCRNEVPQIYTEEYQPRIGEGIVLRDGKDVSVIACGIPVARSIQAAQKLAAEGLKVRVVEMHTIKPLDRELIVRCASETGAIVTAEEHSIIGGLGGAVAECLAEANPVPLERVGIADRYGESGPYLDLLDKYGLSVEAIMAAIRRVVGRKQ